ncbi:geranylgeranylglyceryl/heptaprenylglyceryl phosphate synthase [Candidatus Bathyarchaeota archaeon ex4484_231]|nr:MAG: geranylgeranylglyceryl/heptaprenylglyceryl phosphate synthase [Candidatus Bathyarchaeota archaeon ex4484_231]RJS74465.1 MAG: geranylgeranylglyceryl/heptaprenylglyceryl phosphate synthase [Candidatus Bathyarchaeota archaeon]
MIGKVEKYLLKKIKDDGAIHVTLIDPEDVNPKSGSYIAQASEKHGTSAIMVGGSTITSSNHLDAVVAAIKESVDIPVILFPNNITGISQQADAIWFMSLLNSSDPYFITGAQVLAAPLVRKFGLEPIPLGYLIIGEGGAAAVIGRAIPIPYNKPELTVAHALAAQYLGMRFVYLEAGSGVSKPVPCEMVKMVKKTIAVPLIVGGGIRTGLQANKIVAAGADIIVTSTALQEAEKQSLTGKVQEIVEGIKEGVMNRYNRSVG